MFSAMTDATSFLVAARYYMKLDPQTKKEKKGRCYRIQATLRAVFFLVLVVVVVVLVVVVVVVVVVSCNNNNNIVLVFCGSSVFS